VKKGNEDEIVESIEEEIYQVCKSTGNTRLFVEILEGEVTQFNDIKYKVEAFSRFSISPTEVDYTTRTLDGYVNLVGANR
jgi:hypothetical protein